MTLGLAFWQVRVIHCLETALVTIGYFCRVYGNATTTAQQLDNFFETRPSRLLGGSHGSKPPF
jgi:hypothetical protein